MKKETKKEREKRLNTRLEDPIEDLGRAIEKIKLNANIDDASAGSAMATTEEHRRNIVKKDIAYNKFRVTKASRDADIKAFAIERYHLYRDAGQSVPDARSTALLDVGDEFKKKNGEPVERKKSWVSKWLKD